MVLHFQKKYDIMLQISDRRSYSMKLKSLNQLDIKYGFAPMLEYEDATFHGHQRGIAVGILNQDGSIYRNLMVPMDPLCDKDELFKELLNDKNVKLLEEEVPFITQEQEINVRKIYYLPYANIEHSVFKPTVNYDNMDCKSTNSYHVQIEVLLCKKGLNRYFIIDVESSGETMLSTVRNFLMDKEAMEGVGFTYISHKETDEEETEEGWFIDMYNEANNAGRMYMGKMPDDILSYASSIRLIGIETFSDGTKENETKEGRAFIEG